MVLSTQLSSWSPLLSWTLTHYDHLSNVFTFTFSCSYICHEDFPGHHNIVMGTSTHTTAIIANGKQYE